MANSVEDSGSKTGFDMDSLLSVPPCEVMRETLEEKVYSLLGISVLDYDDPSDIEAAIDNLNISDTQLEALIELAQEKLCLVRCWMDEFALILKQWRPPKVFIEDKPTFYNLITNRIYINVATLLTTDEKLLRILIAHECAHSARRWRMLGAQLIFNLDMEREEVIADQMAMQLTGCDIEELIAMSRTKIIVKIMDDDFPWALVENFLSWRRAMLTCPESEFEKIFSQFKQMTMKLRKCDFAFVS